METGVPYHRTYLGPQKEIAPELDAAYSSELLDRLRAAGSRLRHGDLEIRLPRDFGFCWGVERALRMAHETRRRFPDRRVFLTSEIIHNVSVNERLREMGFHFLSGPSAAFGYGDLTSADVVVIPAFGATVAIVERVRARGATIVDTTCGEVINVWKQVRANTQYGFTSIIHGKAEHDETVATASRATGASDGFTQPPLAEEGRFVVVRDLEEARLICDYMEGKGRREELLARFRNACSEGFDPDRDLGRIGIANQTTMLSGDTLAIQSLFRDTLIRLHGDAEGRDRLRAMDTICSATQARQDALRELLADGLDVLIVLGGYHSSNTGHLAEMGRAGGVPTFHIDDPHCLESREEIRHLPPGGAGEEGATGWWPQKPPRIVGVTAGASTPGSKIGEAVIRVLRLAGADPSAVMERLKPV